MGPGRFCPYGVVRSVASSMGAPPATIFACRPRPAPGNTATACVAAAQLHNKIRDVARGDLEEAARGESLPPIIITQGAERPSLLSMGTMMRGSNMRNLMSSVQGTEVRTRARSCGVITCAAL